MSSKPKIVDLMAGWYKSGRGLDWAAAVVVMGWKVDFIPPAYQGHFDWEAYWSGPDMPSGGLWTDWRPSKNGSHLEMLRKRTREAGKGAQYAIALMNELGIPLLTTDAMSAMLLTIYAEPQHHLRAILTAWGAEL